MLESDIYAALKQQEEEPIQMTSQEYTEVYGSAQPVEEKNPHEISEP